MRGGKLRVSGGGLSGGKPTSTEPEGLFQEWLGKWPASLLWMCLGRSWKEGAVKVTSKNTEVGQGKYISTPFYVSVSLLLLNYVFFLC